MAGRNLQDLFRQVDALDQVVTGLLKSVAKNIVAIEGRIETLEKGRIPHRPKPKVPPFPDVLRDIGLMPGRQRAPNGSVGDVNRRKAKSA